MSTSAPTADSIDFSKGPAIHEREATAPTEGASVFPGLPAKLEKKSPRVTLSGAYESLVSVGEHTDDDQGAFRGVTVRTTKNAWNTGAGVFIGAVGSRGEHPWTNHVYEVHEEGEKRALVSEVVFAGIEAAWKVALPESRTFATAAALARHGFNGVLAAVKLGSSGAGEEADKKPEHAEEEKGAHEQADASGHKDAGGHAAHTESGENLPPGLVHVHAEKELLFTSANSVHVGVQSANLNLLTAEMAAGGFAVVKGGMLAELSSVGKALVEGVLAAEVKGVMGVEVVSPKGAIEIVGDAVTIGEAHAHSGGLLGTGGLLGGQQPTRKVTVEAKEQVSVCAAADHHNDAEVLVDGTGQVLTRAGKSHLHLTDTSAWMKAGKATLTMSADKLTLAVPTDANDALPTHRRDHEHALHHQLDAASKQLRDTVVGGVVDGLVAVGGAAGAGIGAAVANQAINWDVAAPAVAGAVAGIGLKEGIAQLAYKSGRVAAETTSIAAGRQAVDQFRRAATDANTGFATRLDVEENKITLSSGAASITLENGTITLASGATQLRLDGDGAMLCGDDLHLRVGDAGAELKLKADGIALDAKANDLELNAHGHKWWIGDAQVDYQD
jgi:hypothetical protein